jgi:acyl dehydratase
MPVGWSERVGPYVVDQADIIEFAQRWDPRPFHVDAEAGKRSHFGGLVASGVHLIAIRSALVHRRTRDFALVAGLGNEGMDLPNPVRPGDELTLESTVIEARPSRSKPDRGVLRMRDVLRNQRDEPVLEMVAKVMVFRRPAGQQASDGTSV